MAEIPGYYFDAERKRYFKILKSGQAPQPQAQHGMGNYTISSLAQKKVTERRRNLRAPETLLSMSQGEYRNARSRGFRVPRGDQRVQLGQLPPPQSVLAPPNGDRYQCVCVDDVGRIYTGTEFGAFQVYDGAGFTDVPSGPQRTITSVAATNEFVCINELNDDLGSRTSLYALNTGATLVVEHSQGARCMALGSHVVTGGLDGVRVYDIGSKESAHYRGESVTSIDTFGCVSVSGSRNGTIQLIDHRTGPVSSGRHPSYVSHVRLLDPDGRRVLACGLQDKMSVYDARDLEVPLLTISAYHNWSQVLHACAVSPCKTMVLAGETPNIFDLRSGRRLEYMFNEKIHAAHWSQAGIACAGSTVTFTGVAGPSTRVRLWRERFGELSKDLWNEP